MNSHKGFTLIELLIVMAIIALIMGLLFPVVGAAWELSLRLKCQSNMSQLCKSMAAFAAEHDGQLPSGDRDLSEGRDWIGGRGPEMLWGCPQKGTLFPYVKDERVYVCPMDIYSTAEETKARGGPLPFMPGADEGNGRFSYCKPALVCGAPIDLLSQCGTEFVDMDDVLHTMDVIVLVEENLSLRGVSTDGTWCNVDEISSRHRGGGNIGFLDGHVEWFGWQDLRPAMIAWDFNLRTPKGTLSYGHYGFRWNDHLGHWYKEQ
ncbi:MAG: prepilin-type N-terminal cleavage/methylation domain-containing protein [Phycisphaerae bacterium]|nr:prepilin-type N-terminal cleavage/methylation domain-containing protein [Phycisphaerae bacterium]